MRSCGSREADALPLSLLFPVLLPKTSRKIEAAPDRPHLRVHPCRAAGVVSPVSRRRPQRIRREPSKRRKEEGGEIGGRGEALRHAYDPFPLAGWLVLCSHSVPRPQRIKAAWLFLSPLTLSTPSGDMGTQLALRAGGISFVVVCSLRSVQGPSPRSPLPWQMGLGGAGLASQAFLLFFFFFFFSCVGLVWSWVGGCVLRISVGVESWRGEGLSLPVQSSMPLHSGMSRGSDDA